MKNLKIYLTAALLLIASAVIFTSCGEDKTEHYVSLRISLNRTTLSVVEGGAPETLTATVLPNFLAVGKTVTWENSDPSIASMTVNEDGTVTIVGLEIGQTTITARVEDRFTTCVVTVIINEATTDPGVVINGLTWATRNVGAPGEFALTPGATGMLYQFNRNVGWSTTGDDAPDDWDNTVPGGITWETENDPSPAGWRVPTLVELQSLFNENYVSRTLETVDGIEGFTFTDLETGESLFLPASGNRVANGTLEAVGTWAAYWSSTPSDMSRAMYAGFWTPGGGGILIGESYRIFANPIRSVKAQ